MPTAPESDDLTQPSKARGRMSEDGVVEEKRVAPLQAEGRRPVLPSGCAAVSTFPADPATIETRHTQHHGAVGPSAA